MKTFTSQAAQGDLLITRIDALPPDAIRETVSAADYIVAHSETGHHHLMATKDAEFYRAANDPFVLFVVVNEPTTLRHARSFDTHEPIHVDKGTYRVNRQREYTPEGFRRAQD